MPYTSVVCSICMVCCSVLYSPEKWLHNRIYCPSNPSKQIQETHTAYSAGTQYRAYAAKFEWKTPYKVSQPMTVEGGTPLIQLSIEGHAKSTLRDCNFTPHVTIFWKFCWQKSHNQRWNFILSFISWYRSSLLFEIQAREQRHRFSALACGPLHQKRPGPEFMRLQSTHIRISTYWDYLNNNQVILFQIHNK